jgi:hypothetical protein
MPLPVFPSLPGIAWPVTRRAVWDTVKDEALSRKRTRYANRSYPTYQYEAKFNVLRTAQAFAEWQTLQGFLNGLTGGVGLFLYDDPNDDTATAQNFGAGDGASTQFQLTRTLGGFTEPVFFPNVIADIKVSGVTKTLGVDYTIGNYGIITFAAPPNAAAPLTWDGTFFWGCRIDDDVVDFSNFASGFVSVKSLHWSTEKFP